MTITEQIIDTETADGPMAIVHASPEGGSPKRVLIFMDAPGIRPSLTHFAARLAEAGYEAAHTASLRSNNLLGRDVGVFVGISACRALKVDHPVPRIYSDACTFASRRQ